MTTPGSSPGDVPDPGFAQLRVGDAIFQARVAAVCVRSDQSLLLHRTAGDQIWSLPGGRLRVGESISDAVVRELRDETGMSARAGQILWVLEQFFEHASAIDGPGGGEVLRHHEIGIYVKATAPAPFEQQPSFRGRELAGTPAEFALEFRWFSAAELERVDLRPTDIVPLLSDYLAP